MVFNIYLDIYLHNKFLRFKEISELVRKIVDNKKDRLYSLIHLLITLELILLVSTTIVKMIFSTINFVKNC